MYLHQDAPPGFPFAIVGPKKDVLAWVKKRADAVFIKEAGSKISGLKDTASRYNRMYLGQFIARR